MFMKKTVTFSLAATCMLIFLSFEGYSQSVASVRKNIETANKKFITWFNTGKADSIITQYHADACITGKGCGKEIIKGYYKGQSGQYTILEVNTFNVTVNDNLATETGQWKIQLANGTEHTGKYTTVWERVNTTWLILKETQE